MGSSFVQIAHNAQLRQLWLRTLQLDELACTRRKRNDFDGMRRYARLGAEVSRKYLREVDER
jgi:hypothetical protein